MDNSAAHNLRRMGLEKLIPLFQEHEIGMNLLRTGLPTDLQQIVFAKKGGLMMEFREKSKPFYDGNSWEIPETECPHTENPLTFVTAEMKMESQWLLCKEEEPDPLEFHTDNKYVRPGLKALHFLEQRGSSRCIWQQDDSQPNGLTQTQTTERSQTVNQETGDVVWGDIKDAVKRARDRETKTRSTFDDTSSSQEFEDSEDLSGNKDLLNRSKRKASETVDDSDSTGNQDTLTFKKRASETTSSLGSSYIEAVLNSDKSKGDRVKANYFGPQSKRKPQRQQYLDRAHQSILTDLVVRYELKDDSNTELTSCRLLKLAESIAEYFPNEQPGTYFVPYSSIQFNGQTLKKNAATGKLWYKYHNEVKQMIKDGTRICKRKKVNETGPRTGGTEIAAVLAWLESQRELSDRVKTKWEESRAHRLHSLLCAGSECLTIIRRTGKCHVNSYFTKYPFLRQPEGFHLLELDFVSKYPQSEHKLFENWPTFSDAVVKIRNIDDVEELSDAEILIEFCNLVIEVQKSKRVTKKWTANSVEIIEGFILHITDIDKLAEEKERISGRAQQHHLRVSPYVVVVGESPSNITDSYIIVDDIQFEAPSTRHAIDGAFKCIQALHASYQEQSVAIWLLFQKVVYDISTVFDPHLPAIEPLVRRFRELF